MRLFFFFLKNIYKLRYDKRRRTAKGEGDAGKKKSFPYIYKVKLFIGMDYIPKGEIKMCQRRVFDDRK